MCLAMMFVVFNVSIGFLDHVKLIVRIIEQEEWSKFNIFIVVNLILQLMIGGAVCQIS